MCCLKKTNTWVCSLQDQTIYICGSEQCKAKTDSPEKTEMFQLADQVVLVVFEDWLVSGLCMTKGKAWIPGFAIVLYGITLGAPSIPTGTTEPTGLVTPAHCCG